MMPDGVARARELAEFWDPSADYDVILDAPECDAHGADRAFPPMGSARAATLAVRQHKLGIAVTRWIGWPPSSASVAENRRLAQEIERLKEELDTLRRQALGLGASSPMSDARRREVAGRMSDAVGEHFGDRLRSLAWSVDTDPASTATHELAVHIDRSGLTPEQFAAGAQSLHLALVRHLADDELHSVSMVVEPLSVRA